LKKYTAISIRATSLQVDTRKFNEKLDCSLDRSVRHSNASGNAVRQR